MPALLEVQQLAKTYSGVRALENVSLTLNSGEIHALCGENGAGKSTLIKILGGILPFGSYSGKILAQGSENKFGNPSDAMASGIKVVHQELALAQDLSVAENVFLGQEPHYLGWLNQNNLHTQTSEVLATLGQSEILSTQIVRELPMGKRQMVEIARALVPRVTMQTSPILILDEPTSALSSRESQVLLELLLNLKEQGLCILYVSHKLNEVFTIADKITVLRNGSSIATLEKFETTPSQVISLMVGRKLEEVFPMRTQNSVQKNHTLLSIQNWTVPSPVNANVPLLDNISFDLKAGEILGLAGLMGSGRTELVESLFGIGFKGGTGSVKVNGKSFLPQSAKKSIKEGLALVPEDRRKHGLMLTKSIRHNLTAACLEKFCNWFQFINAGAEIKQSESCIRELGIKAPHGEFIAGILSGGNQQKVVLAKWLLTKPKILFLDDPTRGVDVGAKSEIYHLIQKLAETGMGIILISSENEEVIQLAHRILVLRQGKIVAEFKGGVAGPETILELCAGAPLP